MKDRGTTEALRAALRVFGLIVLPAGAFWAVIGLLVGAFSLAVGGLFASVFAVWLLWEARRGPHRSEADLAFRVATGTQVVGIGLVLAEPVIGTAIALGSLIPVILALPYVGRRALTRLMVTSAALGAFELAASALLPWGTPFNSWFAIVLPTSTLVIVYALFQLFLWNASTRLTDTASELRHVIEMSHDLAATLDPKDVGHRLARHIALVSHADD